MTEQEAPDFPRSFTVSIEDVISNMLIDKSQKEYLYRSWIESNSNLKRSDYTILWQNNRIIGIRLKKAAEYINLTITIDKGGTIDAN